MQGASCELGEEAEVAALKRRRRRRRVARSCYCTKLQEERKAGKRLRHRDANAASWALAQGPCAVGRTTDAISGRTALMGSSQRPGGQGHDACL